MQFNRRNINKTRRNGEILAAQISSSSYYSNKSGGGGGTLSGEYLPATTTDNITYIVPHYVTFQETTTTTDSEGNEIDVVKNLVEITSDGIKINGNVIATGEVAAYGSGNTSGSGSGSITIIDNLQSELTDAALSANQGRILNEKIGLLSSGGVATTLVDLMDTTITDVTDKQILVYDATTSKWINSKNNATSELAKLTDTTINNVEDKQILVYDATTSKWVNKTFDLKTEDVNTHLTDTTKHITASERTNWNSAYTNSHIHSNKSVLDGITSELVNTWNNKLDKSVWDKAFYFDTSNNLRVKLNLIGENEVSAYGSGSSSSSSSGAITIVDNLTSTLSDAALSANQGRVLKELIDTIDVGDLNLSDYSKTSHTHSNYSLTSHTHPISAITNLQSTLDGKSSTSHTHTQYASSSHTHAISAITNLQSSLDAKATNTALTAHTANTTYHITSAERTNWNSAYNNLTDWFYKDSNGNIHSKYTFVGDSEISAYGSGNTSGNTSGAITIVDNLTSTLTDAALSANQGRVLKNLIDAIDVGDLNLSDYSKTSHTHSNYSLTSHTHTQYASSSHTHPISAVTNLQSTLDGKSSTSHTHSNYSLTSHTHSAYASSSHTHAISAITNLQSSLDAKATNTALTAHTANTTYHITSAERNKWNDTNTNFNDWFYKDSDGNIHSKYNLIGDSEISAYGSGNTSGSGSGSITIVDNLTSTLTDAALSANQGRVLKELIDTIDVGDLNLSDYSKTSHTHSNYSLTSHTHTQYASSSHTHPISAITNLQSTLDGKSSTSHTHSNYSLTSHTHTQYASSSHTHITMQVLLK